MGLITTLASGAIGARLQLPQSWTVRHDDDSFAEAFDPATAVTWTFHMAEGLHLVPDDGDEAFNARVERYAREMFESTSAAASANDPEAVPRTRDPLWSPVIEVKALRIGNAPALRTVHRMTYQAGIEIVMGHVLVPLRTGLLEVRVHARDSVTGFREVAAFATSPSQQFLPQAAYDDPARDAIFPQHVLSRVRAALAFAEAQLVVLDAGPPTTESVVPLRMGYSMAAPPRFVLDGCDDRGASFTRVSFCTTDGVESIRVRRHERCSQRNLMHEAVTRSVRMHNVAVTTETHMTDSQRAVVVVASGPRVGNVLHWFLDEDDVLWSLAFVGIDVGTTQERIAELSTMASTFHVPRRTFWQRLFHRP